MSATMGSETRSGIGARLRAGRERMGLTLLQVAEKMHVDAKVLESLESERFEWLGAPVYAKGHLRHYAELISENTSELLDMYSAATKPVAPDLTQIAKAAKRGSDPRKLVVPSLIVLIAFALVGMVWWILQGMRVGPSVAPTTVAETLQPAETSAVESAPTEIVAAPSTVSPPPAAPVIAPTAPAPKITQAPMPTPAVSSAKPAAVVAAVSAPYSAARLTAPRRGTPGPVAAGGLSNKVESGAAAGADTVADAPAGRTINVTLKFASDSWVEVYDASGAKLFYDIGAAESSHKLTGTPPLRVTFGNAPGVKIEVNGKRARVPANAVQNDTAQFTINRAGRLIRVSSPADGG